LKLRWWITTCLMALLGVALLAQRAPAQQPFGDDQTAQGQTLTLPAGTVVSVRLADSVNSNKSHAGDHFSGTVDPSVLIANQVVIPRGTEAHVLMVEDKRGGRIHGHAEVELELVSLIINGRKLEVASTTYEKKKGVLAAKAAPEAKASANSAGDVAVGGQPGIADPVIAAFRAPKVEKPAGTRIDFTLTAPFTFKKPVSPNS
jgi:hypothetical protein